MISLLPESILDYSLNERIMTRQGNRHEAMASHNSYKCQEALSYITIAVSNDEEWTMKSTPYEQTKRLQEAGVAAFPSLSNRGLVEAPT